MGRSTTSERMRTVSVLMMGRSTTSEKMRTVASPVGKAPRKMLMTLFTTSDGP